MSESRDDAPTARARALMKAGRVAEAEGVIGALIAEEFGRAIGKLTINRDAYSLNSLNGFVETDAGSFFFKFHQEEGEDRMSGEYYRARILADAGLPVDLPVETSTKPGRQILLYRLRKDRRLAEVARDLDEERDAARFAPVIAAQASLAKSFAMPEIMSARPPLAFTFAASRVISRAATNWVAISASFSWTAWCWSIVAPKALRSDA